MSTAAGKSVLLRVFLHLSLGCRCCDSPHVQRLSASRLQEAQSADDRWKSRTSALEWKWCSLDSMATKRFKRLDGSEDPGTRCCPDACPPPQLKCSFHESACRSLGESREGEAAVFLRALLPVCQTMADGNAWILVDAFYVLGHAMQNSTVSRSVSDSAAMYHLWMCSFTDPIR